MMLASAALSSASTYTIAFILRLEDLPMRGRHLEATKTAVVCKKICSGSNGHGFKPPALHCPAIAELLLQPVHVFCHLDAPIACSLTCRPLGPQPKPTSMASVMEDVSRARCRVSAPKPPKLSGL